MKGDQQTQNFNSRRGIPGAFRVVAKGANYLRHVRPSFCPHVISTAPTRQICVKFGIGDLYTKICRESPKLVKI